MNKFKQAPAGHYENQIRSAFLHCINKNPTVRTKATGAIFRALCTAAGIFSVRGQ